MAYPWTCPFCDRDTTLTEQQINRDRADLTIDNSEGHRRARLTFIVCPNPKCLKFTFTVVLKELTDEWSGGARKDGQILKVWELIPASGAKVILDYVPKAIVEDYNESCAIRDLSAKASATLARRCLQGMIRDFFGVAKGRLIDEIEAIQDKVDSTTWKAIDAVRSVGNIGAHMEKDINVIVDVEPDEAAKLIGLIELLIKEWYVTRHDRNERVKSVIALAQDKKQQKAAT